MTMQNKDTIFFNNKFYYIIAVKDRDRFFDPNTLGYELYSPASFCWHGYNVKYTIDKSKYLLVEELYLFTDSENPKPINNVEPTLSMWSNDLLYENLNLPIDYTGTIFIAENHNKYCCGHLLEYGDHIDDNVKYVNPIELIFINGKLVNYLEL